MNEPGSNAPGASRLRLVDSHCHLQLGAEDSRDPRELIARANECGVELILVPGTDLEESTRAGEAALLGDGIFFAAGFHPHEAKCFDSAAELGIEKLLADPKCVAVGEIGLDFHYDHSPREDQFRALRRQIAMAKAAGLPVILHNRQSGEEMISVLREPDVRGVAGVFHSFCDSREVLEAALSLGFLVSYSGMVTFKAAENVRETVPLVPEDRLLVETDAPFLSPVPHRGKPNEPAFVELVLRKVAELRGADPYALAIRIRENFLRLFGRIGAANPNGSADRDRG